MAKIPINNFDKFIKVKAEMHQTPVDTERLWSNIQKTGGSKRTGILPGALLLLLVSFFITAHLLKNRNSDNYAIKRIEVGATTLPISTDNTSATNVNHALSILFKPDIQISSDPPGNEIFQNINHTNSPGKPIKTIFTKNLQPKFPASVALKAVENTKTIITETVNDLFPESIVKTEPFVALEFNSQFFSEDNLVHSVNKDEISSVHSQLSSLTDQNIYKFHTERFFPKMTLLKPDASRIQHVKFNKGFEIRLNGGVGMVFRNMDLLNPEAGNWMQSREESEHQLEAIRWGMDLKLRISEYVYFFAGLEDFRINERFDYNSLEKRTFTKEGQVARLVYDENSYSEEQGPVEIREEIRRTGTFYNQLRMVNIPFGIGVNQKIGKFSMGLEVAVLINAFHEFDGKMADASNVLVDLKDVGMRVNQIQTARINGVFSYQLSPKWGINFVTGADLPLKSIQLGQHMAQNYLVFQGNIGVCYYW